ncbi:tripartite tricarboxylate transporter TctB family protein [Effusibacillus consociatus]|uniref:Tripartite tricarboxylate transporter TctB family protein n=1 Tax=Effusibacillus consociatus TaxID=1117041 RepID=A0ABV9PXJ9_9BACL
MSKKFDRYTSLLFLVIGAGFMFESRKISESAYGSNVGPDIFPFGLGLILVLLSLRLFYETFRYKETEREKISLDYKRFLIILAAAVLYGFFLEDIGYVIGTFLFLLVGFQTMERGKWISSILVSGLFSSGVYFVFVEVLQGTLPGFPAWLGF